jgi:hypothetical protein
VVLNVRNEGCLDQVIELLRSQETLDFRDWYLDSASVFVSHAAKRQFFGIGCSCQEMADARSAVDVSTSQRHWGGDIVVTDGTRDIARRIVPSRWLQVPQGFPNNPIQGVSRWLAASDGYSCGLRRYVKSGVVFPELLFERYKTTLDEEPDRLVFERDSPLKGLQALDLGLDHSAGVVNAV